MATYKSATQTARELAASRADKILPDSHKVSGKLHFQQAEFAPPATVSGDIFVIDEIPSGVALIPPLFKLSGPSFGSGSGVETFTLEVAETIGSTGADRVFVAPTGFAFNYGATGHRDIHGAVAFVPASNKRRFLFARLPGGGGTMATTYAQNLTIVGIRAE